MLHPQNVRAGQRADRQDPHLQHPGALRHQHQRDQHVQSHFFHLFPRYLPPYPGLPLNNCQIFYQDFTRKVYAYLGNFPFKQEVYLKYELFLDSAIKIRFKSVNPDSGSPSGRGAAGKRVEADPLKKKVKERTIREASDYVGQWRNLY